MCSSAARVEGKGKDAVLPESGEKEEGWSVVEGSRRRRRWLRRQKLRLLQQLPAPRPPPHKKLPPGMAGVCYNCLRDGHIARGAPTRSDACGATARATSPGSARGRGTLPRRAAGWGRLRSAPSQDHLRRHRAPLRPVRRNLFGHGAVWRGKDLLRALLGGRPCRCGRMWTRCHGWRLRRSRRSFPLASWSGRRSWRVWKRTWCSVRSSSRSPERKGRWTWPTRRRRFMPLSGWASGHVDPAFLTGGFLGRLHREEEQRQDGAAGTCSGPLVHVVA